MVGTKRKMAENTSEKSSKKERVSQADTLVRVEIFKKGDKPFDGRLGRAHIVLVWEEALRQSKADLEGFASIQIRGRALRINYRVKKAIVLSDVFKKPEFEWERVLFSGEIDIFTGKVIGLQSGPEVSIGSVVTVCVGRTALEFSDEQLSLWLSCFGKVIGRFKYHQDKQGFKTDDIEVELKLSKHIPEFLPMFGRKIRIFYTGMQKQCNNCLGLGHLKFECEEDSKKDWFTYIEELIDTGDYDIELFGDWPQIIKTKRKAAKPNQQSSRGGKNGRGGRGRGRGRGQNK
jgi:hypothetical protein